MGKWRRWLLRHLRKGLWSHLHPDLVALRQRRISEIEFSNRLRRRSTRAGVSFGFVTVLWVAALLLPKESVLGPGAPLLLLIFGTFVALVVRGFCTFRQNTLIGSDARIKACRIGDISSKDALRYITRAAAAQGAISTTVLLSAFHVVCDLWQYGRVPTTIGVAIMAALGGVLGAVVLVGLDRVNTRRALGLPVTREEAAEIRRRAVSDLVSAHEP